MNNYTGTIRRTFRITISNGSIYTVNNMRYKVTNAATTGKGTVTLIGSTKKKTDRKFTALSVVSTVKIGGITYNVSAINGNAFFGYTYLKKVVVGNGVKTIGLNVFYGCKSLTTVIIGNGVTSIGNKVFYGCSKLSSISILSSKITYMGQYSFSRISTKPVVTVPRSKLTRYKVLLKRSGMPTKAVYKAR